MQCCQRWLLNNFFLLEILSDIKWDYTTKVINSRSLIYSNNAIFYIFFILNRKTGKELKTSNITLHQLKHNDDIPSYQIIEESFLCFFSPSFFSWFVCCLMSVSHTKFVSSYPNVSTTVDKNKQTKKAQECPVITSRKRWFSTVPCRWATGTLVQSRNKFNATMNK